MMKDSNCPFPANRVIFYNKNTVYKLAISHYVNVNTIVQCSGTPVTVQAIYKIAQVILFGCSVYIVCP